MKVGVLSDSHDNLTKLEQAVALLVRRGVEVILHGGDYVAPFAAKRLNPPYRPESIPLYCIYGNNDGERKGLAGVLPMIQDGPLRVELGGRVFVMHHALNWLTDEDRTGADVVIGGHTHEIVNEKHDGVLTLNPGECCGYLTGRATVAIVDTETLTATILDVA